MDKKEKLLKMITPQNISECNAITCAVCSCRMELHYGDTLEESCNTKKKLKSRQVYQGLRDILKWTIS